MPKPKILLADDEPPFLMSVGDFLSDQGYEVECVEDAAGVLKVAPSMDVLVVDVRLPSSKCEGIEVVYNLLRDNLIRDCVPIIFISVEKEGDSLALAAMSRWELPKNRYRWLVKQFELDRLANVIDSELSRLGAPRPSGAAS